MTNNDKVDNRIGVIKAKTIQFQRTNISFSEDLLPNPLDSTIVSILPKLISVEHIAEREVSQFFDLQMTVSDETGQNRVSEYSQSEASIPSGNTLSVNEFLSIRNYPSLSAARIRFAFLVKSLNGISFSTNITEGNDALSPGVNLFVVPVVLGSGNTSSTLIFRGRLDVTVLEGSSAPI